jgi:DNA polymerase (family 10)
MDGFLARRAIDAGVVVTIDGDCHRADALARQMRFGVGTARRGWIEPRHVLNTRGVDDVRRFVAKKRAGR